MGQDPLEAVCGARLHHQLLPDRVRAEQWSVTNITGPTFQVPPPQIEVTLWPVTSSIYRISW